MTPVYAHAGDVFFTRSESLIGHLVRWAETDPGETPAWANHTGVVVEDGWIGDPDPLSVPATVVEALWTVRKGPLATNGIEVCVFAPVPPLGAPALARFREAADAYVGDSYGWWKLIFHLADRALFGGRKILSEMLRIDDRPICSYLAAKVYATVKRSFGMDPQAADPDEMFDYCVSNPSEWRQR